MIPAKTNDQMSSCREILLLRENDDYTARSVQGISGIPRVEPGGQQALNQDPWDFFNAACFTEKR